MRVLLQPAGDSDAGEHYVDTITNKVDVATILAGLGTPDRERIRPLIASKTRVAVWGVTAGINGVNRKKWDRVSRGDIALFAKEGRIFSSAVVIDKAHSPTLARTLWKENRDGETWECLYLFDEVHPQDISYATFNEVMGYKPNAVIQGFNVLDEDRSETLVRRFDLESPAQQPPISEGEFHVAIDSLQGLDVLDKAAVVNTRIEQRFLRDALFGKSSTGRCCICGEDFPVDLLVAAHIKKRSLCATDERKDYRNVVAIMCKLGCDDLFERGYLTVSETGNVVVRELPRMTSCVSRYATIQSEKQCLAWRPKSKRYFDWHREFWAGA